MNAPFKATPEPQSAPGKFPEPSAPPEIPGYELLRRIGCGSYGEVWLARSASGAYHAAKVVYRKSFDHERPFERELSGIQKFEPVSRTHGSQVSILSVGRNEAAGYFFYVMELADDANEAADTGGLWQNVDGSDNPVRLAWAATYVPKTLKSELAAHGRLPYQQCLEVSLCLTKALDHLHVNNLIHRDIKPSNVIFVKGVPKLADIGLVTDLGATISYVGTEGFLPPEGPGTPQADLYSLGKVLYEISTGQDRLDFPELPTLLGKPGEQQGLLELNLVFLKACQTDVRKRYQSAKEMYADLALLQSGKSLRRARALEQKLANLTRLALGAGAAILIAAGFYYFRNQHRLKQLREEVNAQERTQRLLESAKDQTSQALANLSASEGEKLAAQGHLFEALLWYAQARRSDTVAEDKEIHARQLQEILERCPKTSAFIAPSGKINSAALSADGLRVVTTGEEQLAQIWDANAGAPLGPPLKSSSPVHQASFSLDGQRIVTTSSDATAQVWNARTGEPIGAPLKHGSKVVRAEFSPDGRQVLTLADDHTALVWEASSGRLRFPLKHTEQILDGAFSGDGRYIATSSADRTAQVWNAATGEPVSGSLLHAASVGHLAFSPDGRRLATASGSQAQVWNVASGERAHFRLTHDAPINSVAFSPDGRRLLTAGEDQTVRVWDAISGKLLLAAIQHPAPVRQAAFSPDGRRILTVSTNEVRLWNAFTGELLEPVFVMNERVVQAEFSGEGNRLVMVSGDGSARVSETFARSQARTAAPQLVTRSLEDWVALGEFLSGRQIDKAQRVLALKPELLRTLEQTLRKKYPEEFVSADLLAWHRQEAERGEAERRWFGAGFHWGRILAATPNDQVIRARRAHANEELIKEQNQPVMQPEVARRIPERAAGTKTNLINLSAYYNAALTETWFPTNIISSGNDLSGLPRGVQEFGGVEFDVRGLVQLSGSALEGLGARFPQQLKGIEVRQKCQRVHFLQGAGWDSLFGTVIGRYQITYANGEKREVKLVFGQNIRDWWFFATQRQATSGATLAWQGTNPATQALGMAVRIYQMSWSNPLPEVEIASIDFISTLEKSAPFLIAITVD